MIKKNVKKQKPAKEENTYQLEIKLEVNEVGNMGSDAGRYVFDATFMEKPLQREKLMIFKPCCCSPTDLYYFSWTLPIEMKGEGDLIDISSNPIVIKCYKLDLDENQSDPDEIPPDILILNSLAIVDLIDIITRNEENVLKTIPFQYTKLRKGTNVRTWPNMPFLKCGLSTSKPILYEPDKNYNRLSITIECLINLPEKILDDILTCDAGLILRLPAGEEKVLKCSNGCLAKQNKLPCRNVVWNLSHFEHFAKFSDNPINRSFTEENFTTLPTNVTLQNPLLSDDSKLVAFYCEHQCILSQKTLLFIAGMSHLLNIEVFVKMKENPQNKETNNTDKLNLEEPKHFVGFFSLNMLRIVGKTHIRSLVPLSVFNLKELETKCGHSTSVFFIPVAAKKVKSKDSKKVKEKESNKAKGKEKTVVEKEDDEGEQEQEKPNYVINDEGYTTCVAIEINVDPPIVPRRVEEFTIEDMRNIDTPGTHEGAIKHSMNELYFIFRREIKNFVLNMKQYSEKIFLPPGGDLFGAANALLSKKFNFTEATDAEVTQNILENSYIYIINQINKALKHSTCETEKANERELRIHCGFECLILEMVKEAEDFFIMEIRNGKSIRDYLHYAIFALHCLNLELCLVCCEDALKLAPTCYICYLMQAYVAFMQKDYRTAEKLLRCGTLKNDNFVELWLGLFVIHYQTEDKAQMAIDLRNMVRASKTPYETEIHTDNFTIIWKPRKFTDNILNGAVFFIQWRLFEFAEILLGWLVHEYGCQSFIFQYHMALIEFYRQDYTAVLQRLSNITCCTKAEHCDRIILRVHALLSMNSTQAINQLREYIRYTDDYNIDKRTSLMFLKLGKLYIKLKKYRTASFYLKQCVFAHKTFASYICLGYTEIENNHLENAETCFKLSYNLNPFNSVSWGNLAIIYSRKGLILHFRQALKNAREQDYLDKNLADELKRIETFVESAVLGQNKMHTQ